MSHRVRRPHARPAQSASRLSSLLGLAVLGLTALAPSAAQAAELVMFDGKWCGVCKRFLAETAPLYKMTAAGRAMPLRVVDSQQTPPWFHTQGPIVGTPIFVLVDHGRELGRISGYTSRDAFMSQAYGLMALLPRAVPRKPLRARDVHADAQQRGQAQPQRAAQSAILQR